jgi:hypothetical protein
MAYALRYQAELFWVGPGAGPMSALTAPALPGSGGGTGQLLEVSVNTAIQPIVNGAGAGGIINSTDITNLTNAMAADIAAQLNLTANLSRAQGWVTGNP